MIAAKRNWELIPWPSPSVGKCVMPTEGIFAVAVREGTVRAGEEIEILEAKA